LVIRKLLGDPQRGQYGGAPETNPLRDVGALDEAQLLDIQIDAVRSTAWVLFDCRGALQIRKGNTAVLAVRGLKRVSWSENTPTKFTPWYAVRSEPQLSKNSWRLTLACIPDGDLQLEAQDAELFVGDVPGCNGPQPDYTSADDETVRAGTQDWNSEFMIAYAVFVNTTPSEQETSRV
jgi:hypothetical protein